MKAAVDWCTIIKWDLAGMLALDGITVLLVSSIAMIIIINYIYTKHGNYTTVV